ncbi:hypothetical protein Hdeb2414_s1166g00987321 [Helianthus debilis subsp. tardiflorus]
MNAVLGIIGLCEHQYGGCLCTTEKSMRRTVLLIQGTGRTRLSCIGGLYLDVYVMS